MIGQQMGQTKNWIFVQLTLLMAGATIIVGFTTGPRAIYIFSSIGLVLVILCGISSLINPFKFPPLRVALFLGFIFIFFLITGATLEGLFLRPLDDQRLQIPPLGQSIYDIQRNFSLKGPTGWSIEHKTTTQGEGILLRPTNKVDYMGVSELQIFIRTNDGPIRHPEKMLEFLSRQLEQHRNVKKRDTFFDVKTEPALMLDKSKGLWSIFRTKKLWVPITQVTLMGIKNNRYICTVSAIGLESHSTLYRVLCLGIFQTIKKTPTSE